MVGGEFEKGYLSQFVVEIMCHNIKFEFYFSGSDSLMVVVDPHLSIFLN